MPKTARFSKDVYVSFHPKDTPFVEKLLDCLTKAHLEAVIDREFEPGLPKEKGIQRAVDTSRRTLLILSQDWLDDSSNEFQSLIAGWSDPAGRLRRVIPVIARQCSTIPERLRMLTPADFTGSEEQSEEVMTRLLGSLQAKSHVFLSFAPGIEPDQSLAGRLRETLEGEGHTVATEQDATVGMTPEEWVHKEIKQSDFLTVLLSSSSVVRPEIVDQVRFAASEANRLGKGQFLPVRVKYTDALPEPISNYLGRLTYADWQGREDDQDLEDRLLDAISLLTLPSPAIKGGDATPATTGSRAKLWPNGTVLPISFLGGESAIQWKVAKAALEWTRYANVRFVFCDDPAATIRVSFDEGLGSWAYQAMDALAMPRESPTANFGWFSLLTPDAEIRRVVLHEFGDVLGLVHEHQIAAAAIPWNKQAVYATYTAPPQNWTRQQVDQNFFLRWEPDYFPIPKPFDPRSIMAFPVEKEHTDGSFEIGWNQELSEMDKEFIGRLYPGGGV
jgi:hypothetical protein